MGVLQLVNLGLPLLSLPYLARVLGVEQLGRVVFAFSIAQIFMILTDYGFNLSASKAVSVNRHNPEKVAEIWCSITVIRMILASGGLLCIGISALIFDRARNEFVLFAIAYIMVFGNVLHPQWLFQGLEKLKVISIVQLAARVIVFVLIFLLVRSKTDIYWAIFLQSGGGFIGGFIALPLTISIIDKKRIHWPNSQLIILQLQEGWDVFLSTATINIYTVSNPFFLGLFVEPATLGYYHIAEKIIRAFQALYDSISNTVYPHVSRLATNGIHEVLVFNKKLFIFIGGLALLLSVVIFFVAPLTINKIFGDDYKSSVIILRVFSLLPIIFVASNIFGMQTMLPLGMDKVYSRISMVTALSNLFIFIPASLLFGIIGAAWANVVIALFVSIIMGVQLHQVGRNPITYDVNQKI